MILLALGFVAAIPAVARASDTFADASRPDDSGDCLTPATACRTINGAVAKASAGFAVRVEPGTYAENVALSSGVSLVADSGNPVMAPPAGPGVTVTGGPAVKIVGLTFASSAAGAEVLLGDAVGNAIVTDNSFIDRTPGDANQAVGIRTTSTGAPKIANNGFTLLQDAIEVISPTAGASGRPLITANTISGVPAGGRGILVASSASHALSGATSAAVTGNVISSEAERSTGVLVSDGGSTAVDPTAPGAGVIMVGNRVIGLQVGLRDLGGRAAVTSFGDVIATAESLFGPAQTAIDAEQVNGLGGDLSVTNADLLDNIDPVVILSDSHLTLDSSIVTASILERGVSSCAITFSAGPTTGGDSCQTFQSDSLPSFFNPDNPSISDFHLIAVKDAPFIDHGNPAAPPDGASDIDGDPRAIDGDGICPLNPIRDIGADEFNPGVPTCPPPPVTPPPPVVTPPPAGDGGGTASPGQTGKRATALKKCKRRHGAARRKCVRRARHLPV